jgi:glycosyltransferase 2 family protein
LKSKILDTLKVVIPLGIGVFVAWYQFDKLSEEQIDDILSSFRSADYIWVLLSVAVAFMSHWSRAYRWRYLLVPMGITIRFVNSILSVFIGYVANLILPRFGEVWRCVMVSRFERQPFEKLFGTVVAERIADVIVVNAIIALTIVLQFQMLGDKIAELMGDRLSPEKLPAMVAKLAGVVLMGAVGAYVFWRLLRTSTFPLFVKLRGIVSGLTEGVTSILRMRQKGSFLAHTLFIWAMYLVMFWLPFLSLPETANVPLGGVLAAFVIGTFSIALVQGGIGVYPIAVAEALRLYGVPYESGLALGWIVWTSQTAVILLFGGAGLVLMPVLNKGSQTIKD